MKFVHVLLVGLLAFACGWIGFLVGDQRVELSHLRDSHTSLLEGLSRQVEEVSRRLDAGPALAREREAPHTTAALRELLAADEAGDFSDDGYFGWSYARVHEVFGRPGSVSPSASGAVGWSYEVDGPSGEADVSFQFVDGICTSVRVDD